MGCLSLNACGDVDPHADHIALAVQRQYRSGKQIRRGRAGLRLEMGFHAAGPLCQGLPEALADGIVLLVREKIETVAVLQILR